MINFILSDEFRSVISKYHRDLMGASYGISKHSRLMALTLLLYKKNTGEEKVPEITITMSRSYTFILLVLVSLHSLAKKKC